MLIVTYALSTFSIEQKKERGFIHSILHYMQANLEQADPVRLESQLNELTRFADSRHKRSVAFALMPAVRRATHEAAPLADPLAGPLLADLAKLHQKGSELLRLARRNLQHAFRHGQLHIESACKALERYCQNLLQRLAKEEQELLPLARRVISSGDWFAIGSTLLSHDAPAPGPRTPRAGITYATAR
jgi:hemerythrin-like domain-containing protein